MKLSDPALIGSIPDYIAGFLVVVGWLVLYNQSLAIKRRDEVREIVARSSATIEEVLVLCEEYYGGPREGRISYKSSALKSRFRLLTRYVLLLKDAGVKIEAYEALANLKVLATGNYFETTRFRQQENIPNWKQDLSSSAMELRFLIERAYFQWSNGRLGRESQTKVVSMNSD